MNNEREYELEVISPYRKKLLPGDLFAMKFDEDFYMHGRIINTEAFWTPSGRDAGLANLIYIYDRIATHLEDYDVAELDPSRLLVSPIMTNRLGWSRGYFFVVTNLPLKPEELLAKHVFRKKANRDWYFDDAGNEVEAWDGPIGLYGLASYSAVQLLVLDALGLKCKGYNSGGI